MSNVIGESYTRVYPGNTRSYGHKRTPEDMVKLYNTPASADIFNVFKSSTPVDQYRCPATTPVCHFSRGEFSARPGHRNIFLTQAYNEDIAEESNGRHVFGYYFKATKNGDRNLQQETHETWLNNLCARPVEEIVNKSLVQLPVVKSRHFWPHKRPTQGEKSLVRAWEQNTGRSSRRDTPTSKHWTHSGRSNVSDSAFPDYLTGAGSTVTRYAGHVYRLSLENKDSSGEEDESPAGGSENQISGPVVLSCTIQELPSRSARSRHGDTPKSDIHLPKLTKRKKKKKQKKTAEIENTPTESTEDRADATPSVDVKLNTSQDATALGLPPGYRASSIINILRATDEED